ncbi:MAG: hypothetical protein Q7R57_00170, partial [Dehalococcoidales bacterium]|nr:hypothetical protein [Dehalococcoidales bacterium]
AGVGQCTDICVLERNKEPVFYKDGCRFIAELNRIYKKHQQKLKKLYEREIIPELNNLSMEVSDEDK